MSSTTIRQTLFLFSLAAVSGCGGDLTLPSPTGEGVALSIVDGNRQIGRVGEELPRPLVVSVESGGSPAPNHAVAFAIVAAPPGVEIQPDTAFTGEDGRAATHVTLGTEMGPYEIEATLVVTESPPSAVFEGSAVAGAPDTLRAASPLSQPGRWEETVEDAPTVVVLDRFGNPVAGAEVHWEVTAGGGTVTGGTTADTEGLATVTWTLGANAVVQKLSARVEGAHGSPVNFTAVALF
jgi:hypothetical protein